ncbi:hypothetical protein ABE042_21730 [Viridibacillus arvi]|uniref:hypothetical protein n=1 Tax=Viridibacillus arvi TaxID=263475 RepID=UPI003D2A5E53
MKKILISVLTLTLSLGMFFNLPIQEKTVKAQTKNESMIVKTASAEDYAYRNTYWGDSKKQVKKAITSKLIGEDKTTLVYKTKALGYPANMSFTFKKNKLTDVVIIINSVQEYDTWGKQKYLHDHLYKRLKKELNTKKKGFTSGYDSYDKISTLWDFESRRVFLSVGTSDWDYETRALILYTEPKAN